MTIKTKFNIGDVVKTKDDLKMGHFYGSSLRGVTYEDYIKTEGDIVERIYVYSNESNIEIVYVLKNYWFYTEEMLERI